MADLLVLPKTPEELRREHQQTRLVALSSDRASSPSFTLCALAEQEQRETPYGWGFAWYPEESRSALVVKDPSSLGENAMTKVLREWEGFESTVFVAHLRGAARTLTEQDTHPFARSFGGRDWVFAHNGDLEGDLGALLPLGDDGTFDPIGRTDSERAFCWLLSRLRAVGARKLSDVGWGVLHGWFRELDALGTANLLFTDGTDLVAYHDDERYNGLYHARLLPPHATRLFADDIAVDLSDAGDRTRVVLMFSTVPLQGTEWTQMSGGQMLVARRGAIIHDSVTAGGAPASVPRPVVVVSGPPLREAAAQQAARGSEETPKSPPPPRRRPKPRMDTPTLPLTDRGWLQPGTKVLSVVHQTVYGYERAVERSSHLYRLRPVHDRAQELIQHELSLSSKGLRYEYEDVFGNMTTRTEVETPYTELSIASRSLIRVRLLREHDLFSQERRAALPLAWMPWQRQMMMPYLLPPELPEPQLRELYEYALSFGERQGQDLSETLLDINRTIYRDYRYVSGSTNLETTPFDVYVNRRGVCQDFANLFICMARLLSIPARYRVGYIFTGATHENKMQSEASHAWVELYLPGRGWVGFDPTNGCLAGLDHIRVAVGRNYRDATPTSGTLYKGGGFESLDVDVRVEELK